MPNTTAAKAVDTEGPTVSCPQGVFGLTNDSYARTSVQWWEVFASDQDTWRYRTTCSDDDEGRTVVSGDFFKAGTTTVTCTAWDAAGNPGQCTFQVSITVCNMTRLGMESGAITVHQITAKDVLNDDYANYGPAQARLNSKNGSWCGAKDAGTWIQVDMGQTVDIYGLILQGRYESDEYVKRFRLRYSKDGEDWKWIREANGIKHYRSERTSDGQDVVVSVQTASQRLIQSRFIRINPVGWIVYPCIRVELISCN